MISRIDGVFVRRGSRKGRRTTELICIVQHTQESTVECAGSIAYMPGTGHAGLGGAYLSAINRWVYIGGRRKGEYSSEATLDGDE